MPSRAIEIREGEYLKIYINDDDSPAFPRGPMHRVMDIFRLDKLEDREGGIDVLRRVDRAVWRDDALLKFWSSRHGGLLLLLVLVRYRGSHFDRVSRSLLDQKL